MQEKCCYIPWSLFWSEELGSGSSGSSASASASWGLSGIWNDWASSSDPLRVRQGSFGTARTRSLYAEIVRIRIELNWGIDDG